MKTHKRIGKLLSLIFFFSVSLTAQTNPQVSTVFAVLTRAVESKNATTGQEVILRTISDVVVDGEVIIPRDSKLVGHVAEAITKGRDEPQSVLSVIIDKAVRNDRSEVPLQAIIVAVAAPQDKSLSTDPTYGMMHSNEPKMIQMGPGSPATKAASTAAVATADIKGRMDAPLLLTRESQGALGYEGLSLSWHLMAPPPVTVFASKGKNVKLDAETQMLLRMASPHLAR